MDDLAVFKDALPDVCTECNGTGRDAHTSGALWCAACKGKGTRKAQEETEEENLELKKFIDGLGS